MEKLPTKYNLRGSPHMQSTEQSEERTPIPIARLKFRNKPL